jgi:hypothetical protein
MPSNGSSAARRHWRGGRIESFAFNTDPEEDFNSSAEDAYSISAEDSVFVKSMIARYRIRQESETMKRQSPTVRETIKSFRQRSNHWHRKQRQQLHQIRHASPRVQQLAI